MAEPTINPYASPQTPIERAQEQHDDVPGVWRDGRKVIVAAGAKFPKRCVFWNRSGDTMIEPSRWLGRRTGIVRKGIPYWSCGKHAWRFNVLMPTLLAGILIFAVAALLGCNRLLLLRQQNMYTDQLILFPAMATGIMFLLTLPILLGMCGRVLHFSSKRDGSSEIRNCGHKFLDSLPTREEIA